MIVFWKGPPPGLQPPLAGVAGGPVSVLWNSCVLCRLYIIVVRWKEEAPEPYGLPAKDLSPPPPTPLHLSVPQN